MPWQRAGRRRRYIPAPADRCAGGASAPQSPVPPVFAEPAPTDTVNGKTTKSTGLKDTREALTYLP